MEDTNDDALKIKEISSPEDQDQETTTLSNDNKESNLSMEDIIAAAAASPSEGVKHFDVEELNLMDEESEDIGVICAMVNQQEEFSKYPFIYQNLRTHSEYASSIVELRISCT